MPDGRRGRLDRAIDRAVRDMVQIDPQPGLRHRVADRLQGARPTGASRWQQHVAWPALATAAALVVVAAAAVLLRSPVAPAPAETQVVDAEPAGGPAGARATADESLEPAVAAPQAPRRAAPEPGQAPRAAAGTRSTSSGLFGERTGRLRAASLVDPADHVMPPAAAGLADDGFADPLPGGLEPLAPIAIDLIQVAPIAVRPVTLSALPGGR